MPCRQSVSESLALRRPSTATSAPSARWVSYLLGPATIVLAVPLVKNFDVVRRNLYSMGLALSA